ncbi:MAG: GAF domain-containing protein [Deltaproteobacteria bacterium]|nr:MAG: GAF domain-containing protein [Deltaproteobacteria bacterium]
MGHSLAGRVAQTRGPIASREAASDPMVTRESIRRTGLRGYYGVPMMVGEELVGVATIGSRHANEFSEEDRLLFRTMSGRAAALIAKARLNAELTRRNAELSAALDYRDRMLGILSHDLKNPLGVILASSYVLEKAGLDDAQKRSLARVTSAAGRIDRMIKDLSIPIGSRGRWATWSTTRFATVIRMRRSTYRCGGRAPGSCSKCTTRGGRFSPICCRISSRHFSERRTRAGRDSASASTSSSRSSMRTADRSQSVPVRPRARPSRCSGRRAEGFAGAGEDERGMPFKLPRTNFEAAGRRFDSCQARQ